MKNKLLIIISLLSFLGFLDSTYLAISHYKNVFPPCSITQRCEAVLTSQFSEIFGIPLSLFGSLFYLSLMIFSILVIQKWKEEIFKLLFFIVTVGFILSIILFFIQLVVLKAFCQYCLLAETLTALIFITTFILKRKSNTYLNS